MFSGTARTDRVDRLIQQAVMQVLQRRWDPTFSESSYGFRPGRSAQQAAPGRGVTYVPADREISAAMQEYWTNFAKTGNPNSASLPQLPGFDATARGYNGFHRSLACRG
jgi:Carboxylesterase family